MARTDRLIKASPSAVFDVLADPRSYVYWVIGSREIRGSDPNWPQPGSRFAHTINLGPLRVQDHTEVEELEPDRRLQLKARARPFGTARIAIELDPVADGTSVTIREHAADPFSAFLFQPLTHLAVQRRNARALDRLAELAEGRRPMPGEEREARVRWPGDCQGGAVVNPLLRERRSGRRQPLAAVARGTLAGLAGAALMSLSTNAEMRLRGRAPSDAPARVVERLLRIRIRGRQRRRRAIAVGHATTSMGVGAARGAFEVAGMPVGAAAAATLGLALVPELVIMPATGATAPPWRWTASEAAVSILHHAVFAGTLIAAYEALAPSTDED